MKKIAITLICLFLFSLLSFAQIEYPISKETREETLQFIRKLDSYKIDLMPINDNIIHTLNAQQMVCISCIKGCIFSIENRIIELVGTIATEFSLREVQQKTINWIQVSINHTKKEFDRLSERIAKDSSSTNDNFCVRHYENIIDYLREAKILVSKIEKELDKTLVDVISNTQE